MGAGAYTPTFAIFKGEDDITANFQNRATSITVELQAGDGAQDTVTITVDDRDWLLATPHVGDNLEVYLGYKEVGLAYMGTFEIDEVILSYLPKNIQVHGNSTGFNSKIKSQTTKNFEGKTVKEILEAYGKELGLQVVVDQDIGQNKVPYFTGTASPMAVIGQFERMYGAVAKIADGRLSFADRDSGLSASGQEIPLVVLRKEHIAQCQVRHLNRHDYTSAQAKWINKDTNKEETAEEKSAAGGGVLGQGESGGEKPFVLRHVFPSEEEAKAAAKSQIQALDRKLGEGLFTLSQGDPWIRDANRILVIGTRDGIDGSYVADIVAHTYTKDGALQTSIRTQAPGGGEAFAPLYAEAPDKALAPGPGQLVGEVMPQATTPGDQAAQGRYAPSGV